MSRRRWLVLPLSVAFLLTPLARAEAADLEELVRKYEEVKTAWLRAKRQPPGRGGPGGPGRGRFGGRGGPGGRDRDEPEPLFPAIRDVARVDTKASFNYVVREYADAEPEVAVAAGRALLSLGSKDAVKVVVRAFDRRRTWTISAKAAILDELAAAEQEDGFEFVEKLATRGRGDLRAIAIGSLAQLAPSEKAAAAIVESIDDRNATIRGAALRALARFRIASIIPPLIERIDDEKDEKLQVDALQLLVSLTGVNMGLVADDWTKWWEGAQATFEVGEADASGATRVVASDLDYFGIEVSSKRIAFLVDASVSMDRAPGRGGPGGGPGGGRGRRGGGGPPGGGGDDGGGGGGGAGKTKLEIMKAEMVRILKELPDETVINMLFFHRTVVPWKDRLTPLEGRGREEAIGFVEDLTTGFGTNIYDTLEQALADDRVDTIYLLSDGEPYGGKYERPEDILREIGAINRVRGATIHCIAFGAESKLLEDLARENGGEYRFTSGESSEEDEVRSVARH